MLKLAFSLLACVALMLRAGLAGDGPELFQAIRNGDAAFIKAHLTKAEIVAADPLVELG